MYIIVKYGNNESLLCNPSCAVINLLSSIKSRTGFANTNKILDLSDETGLVKELDMHKKDYAGKYLTSHSTYVLVQKELIMGENMTQLEGIKSVAVADYDYLYTPLLEQIVELFPEFKVHVQEVEIKKPRRQLAKSPSPAGRFPKSKKGGNKTKTKRSLTPKY
ncbi:hypothetical protein SNE40_009616 [Patella caerulea]|uniref:Uncharacterized protein n=1 Tax=Patella caerulea TaxID=87958 RepID=A0AAN8JYX3_PATCE